MKILSLPSSATSPEWTGQITHDVCGSVLEVSESDLSASSVVDGTTYRGKVPWFRCPYCSKACVVRRNIMPFAAYQRVLRERS